MRFEVFASFCMILAALADSIEAQHNETEIAPTVAANSINGTIEFGKYLTSSLDCSQANVVRICVCKSSGKVA